MDISVVCGMIDKNGKYFGPLSVNRHLDLGITYLKELPIGLSVAGSLGLRDTQIKELPVGLSVGWSLNTDTPMFVPFIHKVGGCVYVKGKTQTWLITSERECFIRNRERFLEEVRYG